jgi:hypothetical protein
MSRTTEDIRRLRTLAAKTAQIAALPVHQQNIARWKAHNSLQSTDPMLLVYPEGSWTELVPPDTLVCENPVYRNLENELLQRKYYHEHLQDDHPITAPVIIEKQIKPFDWGLREHRIHTDSERGSYEVIQVLKEPSDADALIIPEVIYDQEATEAAYALVQEAIGDLLPVHIRGVQSLSFHFSAQYIAWRGLQTMLMDLYLEPELVHRVMQFLTDAYGHILDELVRQELIDHNCDGSYQSSGGNGYIDGIDDPESAPALSRMWGSAESQELASVSPEQHRDFLMVYEAQILKRFALTGYGCCDDLTDKLDDLFSLVPNLRRVSVSPWADVSRCARSIGDRAIFSWKPQPADLVGVFDEERIRGYLRNTLQIAQQQGTILEIILKDTHTVEGQPQRFPRWIQIAREEIQRTYGRPAPIRTG